MIILPTRIGAKTASRIPALKSVGGITGSNNTTWAALGAGIDDVVIFFNPYNGSFNVTSTGNTFTDLTSQTWSGSGYTADITWCKVAAINTVNYSSMTDGIYAVYGNCNSVQHQSFNSDVNGVPSISTSPFPSPGATIAAQVVFFAQQADTAFGVNNNFNVRHTYVGGTFEVFMADRMQADMANTSIAVSTVTTTIQKMVWGIEVLK